MGRIRKKGFVGRTPILRRPYFEGKLHPSVKRRITELKTARTERLKVSIGLGSVAGAPGPLLGIFKSAIENPSFAKGVKTLGAGIGIGFGFAAIFGAFPFMTKDERIHRATKLIARGLHEEAQSNTSLKKFLKANNYVYVDAKGRISGTRFKGFQRFGRLRMNSRAILKGEIPLAKVIKPKELRPPGKIKRFIASVDSKVLGPLQRTAEAIDNFGKKPLSRAKEMLQVKKMIDESTQRAEENEKKLLNIEKEYGLKGLTQFPFERIQIKSEVLRPLKLNRKTQSELHLEILHIRKMLFNARSKLETARNRLKELKRKRRK